MRITINRHPKPLNHVLWVFIYLLCFLAPLVAHCEDTTTIHAYEQVTYNRPLLENLERWYHTWRIFYGTTKKEAEQPRPPVPDAEQTPHFASLAARWERTRKHYPASGRATRILAYAVRPAHHRRSHRATHPCSPHQAPLHETLNRILRDGSDVW